MVSKLNLFCPILHLSIFQQKIVGKLELNKVFDEGNDDETKEWIMFKEGGRNTYSAITHVPELLAIVAERIPDQSFKINWADEVLDKGKNTTSVRHCIDNLIRKKILFEHKQKVGDGRFRWIQLYILFQLLVLVYARFCRLVLIVPFFLIPHTKPSSSSCCCRSSVIQLFGRESILFFRSRRCRFTQIANG